MDPSHSSGPAQAGFPSFPAPTDVGDVTVLVADPAWRRWLRRPEAVAAHAARMAGGGAVRRVFAGDRLIAAWLESRFSF